MIFVCEYATEIITIIISIIMAFVAVLSLTMAQRANKLIKKSQEDAQKFEINRAMPIINLKDLTATNPPNVRNEIHLLLENIGNGPALNINFEAEAIEPEDKQEKITYEVFGWDKKLQQRRNELEDFSNLIIGSNNSFVLVLNSQFAGDEIFPGDFLYRTKIIIKYTDTFGSKYCSEINKGRLSFKLEN